MSEGQVRQRLAAILAADAAGYSRSMAADERATVAALDSARAVFRRQIEANQGRLVDTAGDSILAVFETATGAVAAALAVQHDLADALRFRIGVHLGEIIEKPDGTVYGDGVNIAARLQALAQPGDVSVSDAIKGVVGCRVCAEFVDQGEQKVKNIPDPLRWHRALPTERDGRGAVLRARTAVSRTAEQLNALPSIAIIPFRTATASEEQICFADGLRTDIQWALAKIAGLILIGTPTTNGYRGKDLKPQQVGLETGARYLLEGFAQKAGNRIRLTATLIESETGRVIWTEQYDRVLDNTLEVQDEITERIVTALDVKLLNGDQARVWRRSIRHPRAREHFYRGIQDFMKGQKEANAAAREAFEQVARLAPECSIGPTSVALTHWFDAYRGWEANTERSLEMAEQWARRAMPMDDVDGQAHTVMAHIHLLRREHDKALDLAQQAVALRPGCSTANAHLGNILYYNGRAAEAADRLRQAMRLTPVHPPWFEDVLAASCKELREWEPASNAAAEAVRRKADDVDARLVQIEVCNATGKTADARRLAAEVKSLQPAFSVAKWAEKQPYRDPEVLARIAASLRAAGLPA